MAGAMPAAALASGWVDLVLPLAHAAHALVALTIAPSGADLSGSRLRLWVRFAA